MPPPRELPYPRHPRELIDVSSKSRVRDEKRESGQNGRGKRGSWSMLLRRHGLAAHCEQLDEAEEKKDWHWTAQKAHGGIFGHVEACASGALRFLTRGILARAPRGGVVARERGE